MSVSTCDNDKQLEQTTQLTNGQTILGGNEEEKEEKKLNFLKMSGNNKRLFIMLALSVFSCGSGYSLLAPFYPLEAEKKGVSQTIIGLVFSVFSIVSFCASPIIGGMLTILGAKFVCVAGLGLAGCSSLLFGVLDKCPSGTPFIVLSFIVRVVEALGALGVVISSSSIASCQFPDNVSTVVAILAAFYCIGLMIGPTIGGLLYELGGFGLPFWAVGAAILLAGVIIFITLPPQHGKY
ncbi:MFS-type transporter SLC18B1-like [Physella acuta]|uniref:MFS-type transporter SLC18B1-like n=1 Tax=Physella acuta TaxID=109671 RepID=UPI0027DD0755|nr:MFS-type transporter SLC18B1-like [Physella acuta]